MDLMAPFDRCVDYIASRIRLRTVLWVIGVPLGLFALLLLFVKSDLLTSNMLGSLLGLVFVVFYFLPTIEAHRRRKENVSAILILNLFLGWTIVGWVVALVWAETKDPTNPAVVVIPPVLCASCGKYSHGDVTFCSQCGEKLTQG